MKLLTNDAWDLPHSSKIDVLVEPQHTHLILRFLQDRYTDIQLNEDGSYFLYGPEQALLVQPSLFSTKAAFVLYEALCRVRQLLFQ